MLIVFVSRVCALYCYTAILIVCLCLVHYYTVTSAVFVTNAYSRCDATCICVFDFCSAVKLVLCLCLVLCDNVVLVECL